MKKINAEAAVAWVLFIILWMIPGTATTAVFLILKHFDAITWPSIWVWSPVWISATILLCIVGPFLLLYQVLRGANWLQKAIKINPNNQEDALMNCQPHKKPKKSKWMERMEEIQENRRKARENNSNNKDQ